MNIFRGPSHSHEAAGCINIQRAQRFLQRPQKIPHWRDFLSVFDGIA
tara:strand:- start:18447 stop:18587 length:141 start_codon:yes stop_codon:yes gene_type:complete